jgi:hypothetical protein
MELTTSLDVKEIIKAINQLPEDDILTIKYEIERKSSHDKIDSESALNELLLNGPVMSYEQYNAYKENRKKFSNWREI